jgi:hypothetical protein
MSAVCQTPRGSGCTGSPSSASKYTSTIFLIRSTSAWDKETSGVNFRILRQRSIVSSLLAKGYSLPRIVLRTCWASRLRSLLRASRSLSRSSKSESILEVISSSFIRYCSPRGRVLLRSVSECSANGECPPFQNQSAGRVSPSARLRFAELFSLRQVIELLGLS